MDKTLFDFDDEIDNLSNVSERYKVQDFHLIENKHTNEKTDTQPNKTID